MKQLITRQQIIDRQQRVIRAGLRPAFTPSSMPLKPRRNDNRVLKVESTPFKSPLTSRVYFSVFCKGPDGGIGRRNELKIRSSN